MQFYYPILPPLFHSNTYLPDVQPLFRFYNIFFCPKKIATDSQCNSSCCSRHIFAVVLNRPGGNRNFCCLPSSHLLCTILESLLRAFRSSTEINVSSYRHPWLCSVLVARPLNPGWPSSRHIYGTFFVPKTHTGNDLVGQQPEPML